MSIAFLNGIFLPIDQAVIPITDSGFLFGDGVFTSIKVSEGIPQCWPLHFQRLTEQCKILKIHSPELSSSDLKDLIFINKATTGHWRLKIIITAGNEEGVFLSSRAYKHLIMTMKPYLEYKKPLRLISYPTNFERPLSKVKTLSCLERFYLTSFAVQHGFDDVIVKDSSENILETAFSNIFWRSGKILAIPDDSLPFFNGISLKMAIFAAKSLKMMISKRFIKVKDIPKNAQVYICNSMKGIVPISDIDTFSFKRDAEWEADFRLAHHLAISTHTPQIYTH